MKLSSTKKTFLLALIASLLWIHLPLLTFLFFLEGPNVRESLVQNQKPLPLWIKVEPQTPPEYLMDVAKPLVEEIPDAAKAAGLYNIKVVGEETVASRSGLEEKPATPKPAKPQPPVQNQPIKTTAPKPEPILTEEPKTFKDRLSQIQVKEKSAQKELDEKIAPSTQPAIKYSSSLEDQPQSGDQAPFYKVGDRTYINMMAYPHLAYFIELKRKFRIAWNPTRKFTAQDFVNSQVRVNLIFTIDAQGKLLDIKVFEPSLSVAYDNEAVRAVRVSHPFSPPPPELLKGKPELDLSFSFILW